MLFIEALELMNKGKMVRRDNWTLEDGYLVKMDGMKHVWKILTSPQPNAGNHIISVEEMLASNWVEKEIGQWSESGSPVSPVIV